MNYLLDTHIIIWALTNSKSISDEVRKIILDRNNNIFFSAISPWEVEIKHQKHADFKLTGNQLMFLCDQAYYNFLPISEKHIAELEKIKKIDDNVIHNDPFDKMLLAQAKAEDMLLITHDKKMLYYNFDDVIYV